MTAPPPRWSSRTWIEPGIQLVLLALLLAWCVRIVLPFVGVVTWSLIIAVTVYPAYSRLAGALHGRARLASFLFAVAGVLAIVLPAVIFGQTLADGTRLLSRYIDKGGLHLPPPPEGMAAWPWVGGWLEEYWHAAAENLPAVLQRFQPQLQAFASWLLSAAAQASLGLLQFMLAIMMASVLLLYSVRGEDYARQVVQRLSGERGLEYLQLTTRTIRSVAKGILGVALIQALLAGVGMLAAGVPAAGLLTLLCLLFCVAQLGAGFILLPCVAWLFYVDRPGMAIAFLAWSVFVMVLDNILKPWLLGRGVNVPMLVVFIGAIGGFLSNGFIGLFVGAIVLVLGYTAVQAWLGQLPDGGEPGGHSRQQ